MTPDPPGLAAAQQYAGVPAALNVLAVVRERLADDLDAPGALAVIDSWADAVIAAAGKPTLGAGGATAGPGGGVLWAAAAADLELARAGQLISDLADALLGIAL